MLVAPFVVILLAPLVTGAFLSSVPPILITLTMAHVFFVVMFILFDGLASSARGAIPQSLEELASAADFLMSVLQPLYLLAACAFSVARCSTMKMVMSTMMLP